MEQKQVVPPFKPNISGEFGLDNFDSQFTNEPVQLTPDDDDIVRKIDQSEFEGFEYINPLLMSAEECVWSSLLNCAFCLCCHLMHG